MAEEVTLPEYDLYMIHSVAAGGVLFSKIRSELSHMELIQRVEVFSPGACALHCLQTSCHMFIIMESQPMLCSLWHPMTALEK